MIPGEDPDPVPDVGQWPVDPQDDQPISNDRIWIDGCFDFAHHGHAGAILQARRLGGELLVGIHSDEDILANKGPTVMNLDERVSAVNACRWSSKSVPNAPYVTSLAWITHYGCQFVVHGDDITSDSQGEDCYRFVKAAGRFIVVKRTRGISTTDLVGRMLLCTKNHFIGSLTERLRDASGPDSSENDMMNLLKDYSTDETGKGRWSEVSIWADATRPGVTEKKDTTICTKIVEGIGPKSDQRVVYVDGGFDLFSSGHIEFLRRVMDVEHQLACERKWYEDPSHTYSPAYIVAGIHDDHVINQWKGLNYPIMNIVERGLCVLQCKYIHAVVFSAPFRPSEPFISALPYGVPDAVYHGPTSFTPLSFDPYTYVRRLGIYQEIGPHDLQNVNAGEIVQRILRSKERFEARQKMKEAKGVIEATAREDEARRLSSSQLN